MSGGCRLCFHPPHHAGAQDPRTLHARATPRCGAVIVYRGGPVGGDDTNLICTCNTCRCADCLPRAAPAVRQVYARLDREAAENAPDEPQGGTAQ